MIQIESKLFGPNGQKIAYTYPTVKRSAAKTDGSMQNWRPSRHYGKFSVESEQKTIVERSTDLVQSDPHAAGVVDSITSTVIGYGLRPDPSLDHETIGISKESARALQIQQRKIFSKWSTTADASGRLGFGQIQHLLYRNMLQFGEYLALLPMIKDDSRPYSLAVQVLNPNRLKTPSDLRHREDIRQGVEIGKYGEPVAYWIQKTAAENVYQDDSSTFTRITAKQGHRAKVLHGFIAHDPEQVRGIPILTSALKFFRDMNDFLDAELVSNVVTAAFALFIETGQVDPLFPAMNMATTTNTGYKSDGSEYDQRYQEFEPGQIMYGNSGEKPHPIVASRPGATFEPFVRTIKKAMAMATGIPYPVLFKDFDGMNFASYRSALLEAWRIYMQRRRWFGEQFCQPIYRMLMEEAYLIETFKAPDFYTYMHEYTSCDWIGPPKGQIEPIKEIQADILAIQNNLKTRTATITERGDDPRAVFDTIEEEQQLMAERGLHEEKLLPEQKEGNANANE